MILIEKVLLLKKSLIFENCSETDLLEIAAVCEEKEEEKNITVFSHTAAISSKSVSLQFSNIRDFFSSSTFSIKIGRAHV